MNICKSKYAADGARWAEVASVDDKSMTRQQHAPQAPRRRTERSKFSNARDGALATLARRNETPCASSREASWGPCALARARRQTAETGPRNRGRCDECDPGARARGWHSGQSEGRPPDTEVGRTASLACHRRAPIAPCAPAMSPAIVGGRGVAKASEVLARRPERNIEHPPSLTSARLGATV